MLAEKFPVKEIPGQIIVIREAFVEGPVTIEFSNDYWERRSEFIFKSYQAERAEYKKQFLSQVTLLDSVNDDDEVYLWFEDDLFCVVNMWFVIYYVSHKTKAKLYRICPEKDDKRWAGFGKSSHKDLVRHIDEKQFFDADDTALSNQLWEAFVANDTERLKALSFSDTTCFRFLPQVIQAHLDRYPPDGSLGRPFRTLIEILNDGKTNFYEIFEDFWKKDAIYGFGDQQVYNMLKEMEIEFSEFPM